MQLTLKVYTPHAQTWSHVLISTENHPGSQRSNWSYIMGNEKLKNEQNASYCYWKARELFQDVRGLLLSGSVMSDFLRPPELQHARPSCPSPSPGACSYSCPLSWWWQPMISSSVVPFSSCLQSFPALGSFLRSQFLHIRWPKYWSFTFSISPSNEYSGLVFFRIDWLDLLAVQGTLKSLLQHHSSKASILQHSALFIVQLSHPYMTTGKTIALTFVGKVMSLLFNMLSRLAIVFLLRSKCLLISWLQSPSAVTWELKK